MTDIKDKIAEFMSGIKHMIESKEQKIGNFTTDLINKEECKRAKDAFDFLVKQENFYLEKKILEGLQSDQYANKSLDDVLKERDFRSEEEKDLFCRMYKISREKKSSDTHTSLIPFPITKMKRVVVNGKPYLEIDKEGRVFMADGVGNK